MLFITNPETINDLRPNFGLAPKKNRAKCSIERYIDSVMKISTDSELISRQGKNRDKSRTLVG